MATNNHDTESPLQAAAAVHTAPAMEDSFTALLSHRPPWLVRWGIVLFGALLGLLLAATWFIHYPDRVQATGTLMATHLPQELVVRTDGRLQHLFVSEGDSVPQGRLIAVMQSTANYEHLLRLQQMTDSLHHEMANANPTAALHWYHQFQEIAGSFRMGEVQADFQQLMAAIQTFTQYLQQGYYQQKMQMLRQDLAFLQAQQKILQQQQQLTQQDIALAADNFAASNKLANQQVIAPVELRNEQSKWVNKQLQGPQVSAALLNNNMQAHDKQKEIAQLNNEIAQQTEIFKQALQQWQAKLAAWQQQYLIVAPCNGRLSLNGFLQAGANMQRGQSIGSVVPPNAGYYVAVTLSQYNFGKLKIGQQARLRFTAYPYEEFGTVAAQLTGIKTLPTDSGYMGKLMLPNGLVTDKHIALSYRHGLQAQVDIVTDNRRLLQRLLDGIDKAVRR
ncbi:HlyD family efflux transporter periplasmic adaptor subunit [Phnomibacter ginsenosidimutans]|uniref:HlyD family efflux transporter periplasmic adaptor subunit n=1 Tax=Phnomibacter ginsenosidimutans TaxID=2676868 RepID=A0A6I6GCK5_9BACT|nr:HlyD family efflux transporter periplasmic adaptor subunit [Phnomibacter ginsenosidimutans]QGW29473.1 HlyD family efflux transporter periplasmic adaptor subunit [Phnomibacter ginsenosidimutans]